MFGLARLTHKVLAQVPIGSVENAHTGGALVGSGADLVLSAAGRQTRAR